MLKRKTHFAIAKAIRNALISERSKHAVAKLVADFFEADNPGTFNRQQFYDIVHCKINYTTHYIKDEL